MSPPPTRRTSRASGGRLTPPRPGGSARAAPRTRTARGRAPPRSRPTRRSRGRAHPPAAGRRSRIRAGAAAWRAPPRSVPVARARAGSSDPSRSTDQNPQNPPSSPRAPCPRARCRAPAPPAPRACPASCPRASCPCPRSRSRSRPRGPPRARARASCPPPSASGRCCPGTRTGCARLLLLLQLEHREERLLRDLHAAQLLHPLLAFLLALEQLSLARHVAAVALRDHVLAIRLHRLARDDVRADRRLDRNVVLLAGDALAQLARERAAHLIRLVAVHHHRQRVHRVAR